MRTDVHPIGEPGSTGCPSAALRDEAERRHDIAAAALCLAVLAISLIVGHFHRVGGFGVETDFYGAFAIQAKNLLEGRPYTYPHHPPGYPVLLAATSLLTGDLFVAGKIISAVAATVLAYISYLLLKTLFSPRLALGTTVLLLPATFRFSFVAASDVVGAALALLPVWAILRRPVLSTRACLLGGVFAGMAYLVRYDAIFVMIGLGFSILVINLDREPLRPRVVKVSVFAVGALLIASPWLITNWRVNGNPFASTGYLLVATHFYMPDLDDRLAAAVKEPDPAAAVARLKVAAEFHSLLDVVLHDPPGFFWNYVKGLFSNAWQFAKFGLRFPAYTVAPFGLVLLLRGLSRRRLTYLVVCLLAYLAVSLLQFTPRYYLFLLPLGFLSVATGLIEALPILLRRRRLERPVGWLLLLIVAASLTGAAFHLSSEAITSEPRYLLEIADFLKHHSVPGEVIVARKPHLAYLSGLVNTFPFVHTAGAYLREARARGARYVVYSAPEAERWPGLKSLGDPGAAPAGLKLVYDHPASQTLIYEVEGYRGKTADGGSAITGRGE